MRSAGNFHPEWGYLAPTPSFARTLRIALVATAIGATAGAGVVISLLPHRGSGASTESSIAVHALVTSAPAISSAAAAVAPAPAQPAQSAAVSAQPGAASPQQVTANAAMPQSAGAPDPANGAAPAQVAHQVAHVDEPAVAAPAHDDGAPVAEAAPSKKKKHRVSGYEAIRHWQASRETKKPRHGRGGFEPLFGLFSSRMGSPSAN